MQYMNWENPFTNRIWMCSLTTSGLWRLLCVFECPVCSDVPQKLRPSAIRGIRGFFLKKMVYLSFPFLPDADAQEEKRKNWKIYFQRRSCIQQSYKHSLSLISCSSILQIPTFLLFQRHHLNTLLDYWTFLDGSVQVIAALRHGL